MSDESRAVVRRARAGDLDEILDIINTVWCRPDGSPGDIASSHPFLFHDRRVPDHFVYEVDGRLWGVVGAYPYDVVLGGVVFKMAGIGQVISRPEHRGRGVMTALLKSVIATLEEEGYDAAWLMGDRQRYAHFGWARGGRALHFSTNERYLPGASPAAIRPLDIEREFAQLRDRLHALPYTMLMPDEELRALFRAREVNGWALNGSFILLDAGRDRVHFADGRPDEIAMLIAHQQRINAETNRDRCQILIETPCAPVPVVHACREIFASASVQHCASFRIVRLVPFLEKAMRMVEGAIPRGTDRLELMNTDTGEAVTLTVAQGEAQVAEGASETAVRLDTVRITELFFDWIPVEVYLPELAADSPLRALLPLNVFMSHFFAIVV
jgi:GNAT superfamily N-acetyltransferase